MANKSNAEKGVQVKIFPTNVQVPVAVPSQSKSTSQLSATEDSADELITHVLTNGKYLLLL